MVSGPFSVGATAAGGDVISANMFVTVVRATCEGDPRALIRRTMSSAERPLA